MIGRKPLDMRMLDTSATRAMEDTCTFRVAVSTSDDVPTLITTMSPGILKFQRLSNYSGAYYTRVEQGV
jgi:hypothetical protein